MASSKDIAANILAAARTYGFTVAVRDDLMIVSKEFTPGDMDAYVKCSITYTYVLHKLPRTRPGSDWGTTADGVGGWVGAKNGQFEVKRSGGNKRVLKALEKMIGDVE